MKKSSPYFDCTSCGAETPDVECSVNSSDEPVCPDCDNPYEHESSYNGCAEGCEACDWESSQ